MPGPIRETGLKRPLLIKGDRYNFNPQMGVALTDTVLTASELESRMDKDREVGGSCSHHRARLSCRPKVVIPAGVQQSGSLARVKCMGMHAH